MKQEKKQSKAKIGIKRSKEVCKKISEKMKGKPAWNKGKKTGKPSPIKGQKFPGKGKGRKGSEKQKKVTSERMKNIKYTPERNKKVSEGKMGGKNPNAMGCIIMSIDYGSINEAARQLKITRYFIDTKLKNLANKDYQYKGD